MSLWVCLFVSLWVNFWFIELLTQLKIIHKCLSFTEKNVETHMLHSGLSTFCQLFWNTLYVCGSVVQHIKQLNVIIIVGTYHCFLFAFIHHYSHTIRVLQLNYYVLQKCHVPCFIAVSKNIWLYAIRIPDK